MKPVKRGLLLLHIHHFAAVMPRIRMLYRHAPFLLASAGLCLLYYLYSSGSAIGEDDVRIPYGKSAPLAMSTSREFRLEEEEVAPRPRHIYGKDGQRLKTVLYWNEFYGRYDTYDFGYGHEAFVEKESCKYKNCFATKDRNLLPVEAFDAIIIHIRGLPNDSPSKRSPHQRYVMLSVEAPLHLYEYRSLNELSFNWTMTYRLDSDFPIPYAWIERVSPLPGPPGSSKLKNFIRGFGRRAVRGDNNLAEGKVGLAVQFVSNCHSSSQRELYVRELRKYIPVDIYGKCGEFSCSVATASSSSSAGGGVTQSDGGWDCFASARAKYKFLLAFEDALCRDYVTETFFAPFGGGESGGGGNVVPVVLGGANYSALGAPPHSFIDARDFAGPKQLAHFLKLLDADDARYNEYFWWRGFYRRRFRHHDALCDLCERLHATDGQPQRYPDMERWWVDQADCKTSPEAPIWIS